MLARQQAGAAECAAAAPLKLTDLTLLEIADAAPAALARGIDIGLGRADDATVQGRCEPLRILIRNLLDNAVKYTPQGGTVDLEIVRAGHTVELRIEDSGPGIPDQDRQRVLDRFYRVHGTESGGSGLGLAIVKGIADLHGAQVTLARSARLGGLRVAISFAAPA